MILTPHGDMDPCPRVEIVVDAIPGADTITITRTFDGQTEVVRRARQAPMAAPFYVVDYEAPLGVPINYVATGYTAAGAVVDTRAAATQVDVDLAVSWVMLQSPLAPATVMVLPMAGGSLETLARPRAAAFEYAIGSGVPLGMSGVLRAPQAPWTIFTHTDAESKALLSLLSRSGPMLVRSVWPVPLPRLAYVVTDDVEQVPIDAAYHPSVDRNWSAWQTSLQLVRPPAAGIAVPVFTYDDVAAMYPGQTYDDVAATRPGATYLDWVRDPRP